MKVIFQNGLLGILVVLSGVVYSQNHSIFKVKYVDEKIVKIDQNKNTYLLLESPSDSIYINDELFISINPFYNRIFGSHQLYLFKYDSNSNLVYTKQIYGNRNLYYPNFVIADDNTLIISFNTGSDSIYINSDTIFTNDQGLSSNIIFKLDIATDDYFLISNILTGNSYHTFLKIVDSVLFVGQNFDTKAILNGLEFNTWRGNNLEFDVLLLSYQLQDLNIIKDTIHIQSLGYLFISDLIYNEKRELVVAIDCGGNSVRYNNEVFEITHYSQKTFSLLISFNEKAHINWYKLTNARFIELLVHQGKLIFVGNNYSKIAKFESVPKDNIVQATNIMYGELTMDGTLIDFNLISGNNEKSFTSLFTYKDEIYFYGKYAGVNFVNFDKSKFIDGENGFVSKLSIAASDSVILDIRGNKNESVPYLIVNKAGEIDILIYTTSELVFFRQDSLHVMNDLYGRYIRLNLNKYLTNNILTFKSLCGFNILNNTVLNIQCDIPQQLNIILSTLDGKIINTWSSTSNNEIDLKPYLITKGIYNITLQNNKFTESKIFSFTN